MHTFFTCSVFTANHQKLQAVVRDFASSFPDLHLQLLGQIPDWRLQVRSASGSPALQDAQRWLRNCLGSDLYSEQGQDLPETVGQMLSHGRQTLALAESCTGGLLAHLLTQYPGSSLYFLLSAVTYSNQSKIKVLGVKSETLQNFGAVHEQTAQEMASGLQQISAADLCLSATGIAGPGGGTQDKPVGTVCLGLATAWSVQSLSVQTGLSDRSRNKHYFALAALDMLRRHLAFI